MKKTVILYKKIPDEQKLGYNRNLIWFILTE